MYEYLNGDVAELVPTHVIIDIAGVGYLVNITLNSYSDYSKRDRVKVWVHQVVKEDSLTLYGFSAIDERTLFRQLISVSGIGAATAIVMLSSFKPKEICSAILMEDVNLLKSIKGIGAKSAQRVIIELKDKVNAFDDIDPSSLTQVIDSGVKEEASSALIMLGFNKKQIATVINRLLKERSDYSVEELIKLSLKSM